jgi:hypothetical protein
MPPRFPRRRLPVRVEPLAILADTGSVAAPSPRAAPTGPVAAEPDAPSVRTVPTLPARVPSVQPAADAPVPRGRPLARRHPSQPHRAGQTVAPDLVVPPPGRDLEPRVGEIGRRVAEPRSAEVPVAEQAPVRLPAAEAAGPDSAGRVQPPLDLGRVAEDVYVLLSRRLAEERDRRSF